MNLLLFWQLAIAAGFLLVLMTAVHILESKVEKPVVERYFAPFALGAALILLSTLGLGLSASHDDCTDSSKMVRVHDFNQLKSNYNFDLCMTPEAAQTLLAQHQTDKPR